MIINRLLAKVGLANVAWIVEQAFLPVHRTDKHVCPATTDFCKRSNKFFWFRAKAQRRQAWLNNSLCVLTSLREKFRKLFLITYKYSIFQFACCQGKTRLISQNAARPFLSCKRKSAALPICLRGHTQRILLFGRTSS